MTEENQDDALKQLSQSNEADDKPVEGETSSPDKPQENSQLASGTPVDDDPPKQETNIDQEEIKTAAEDRENVQNSEHDKPVEQAQSEPDDDKPVDSTEHTQEETTENANPEGSSDDKTEASEIKEGEEIIEQQQQQQRQRQDSDKDGMAASEEQQGEPAGTQQDAVENNDVTSASEEEQQGDATPAGQAQEEQTEQQEHDTPTPNEQQSQQDSPEHGEGDKPVEFENQEKTEEQKNEAAGEQASERETDGEEANENSPAGQTQQGSDEQEGSAAANQTAVEVVPDQTDIEAQKPDTSQGGESSQEVESTQEDENVKEEVESCVEKTEQDAGQVEKPVESPAAVESEPSTAVQAVIIPAPGELQEENRKLKQEIFMMKQQEDAYRIKVLSLEQEVGKLRARKIDNRSQDSLASDSDSYLKQKLAETERELDTAERKVKDLQLRLKRFAKDDHIKDEKISQMEREVRELSDHTKKLEQSLADSKRENNNNATVQATSDKNDSKVCVIL